MLTELEGISAELRTDKILTRQKAFNKLDAILNTRSNDLKIFLEDSQFISFTDLFNSAHEGILKVGKPEIWMDLIFHFILISAMRKVGRINNCNP